MWEMMNVVQSQVGLYLADGWEPFAVVPGQGQYSAMIEPVIFLKRHVRSRAVGRREPPASCASEVEP